MVQLSRKSVPSNQKAFQVGNWLSNIVPPVPEQSSMILHSTLNRSQSYQSSKDSISSKKSSDFEGNVDETASNDIETVHEEIDELHNPSDENKSNNLETTKENENAIENIGDIDIALADKYNI